MPLIPRTQLPLILGGHSFISQLGNDPAADFETQVAIVKACLDHGIQWIDTTYQPERIALGKVLQRLPRRADVKIIAWNFFRDFDSHGDLGGPDYLKPDHLQIMLDQLQVDHLDALVVHWIGAPETNFAQEQLVLNWVADGRVKQVGIWSAPADALQRYAHFNPYQFVVLPTNITSTGLADKLAWARTVGWQNVGTSPYVRGWHLDKLVTAAIEQARKQNQTPDPAALRETIAGLLLRYALFLPNLDRLIVAMRKPLWVEKNAHAVLQGALTPAEQTYLATLQAALPKA